MRDKLEAVFEKIEDALDLDHVEEVEKLHLDSMHYEKVSRIPLSVSYPADPEFQSFTYAEAFHDPEKMLYNELVSIGCNVWNSVRIKDDYPLQIRPNYGIGVIPSLFGAEVKVKDDIMPWVVPLDGEEAFRKAISHGVPDVNGGLAGKVKEAYEIYREWLHRYPKCERAIHLTQPDMQGPFDNVDLMRGMEIFYDLYDEPEMVHEALNVVTDTMIAYQKSLPVLNDRAGKDCFYIHFAVYGGNMVIKLDTETAMLSEEMFEEFCKPYNERILKAMGGGSIHFCGGGKEWPARQMHHDHVTCLNFGNPEMQDLFTSWKDAREKKIPVVGYGQTQSYEFARQQMEKGIRTGVTFLSHADSLEEAQRAVEEHRMWCEKHF